MNIFTVSGDLLRLSASAVLLLDLQSSHSASGLSRRSLELALLACALKYLDLFMFFVGIYNWGMKVSFLALTAYPVYLMRTSKQLKSSYDAHLDTFPVRQLLIPCLLLSLVFNPAFNIVDILYSFAVWLDIVAFLPQAALSKNTAEPRDALKHWIVLWTASRLMYVVSFAYRFFSDLLSVNKLAFVGTLGQALIALHLCAIILRKREKPVCKTE